MYKQGARSKVLGTNLLLVFVELILHEPVSILPNSNKKKKSKLKQIQNWIITR